MFTVIEDNSMDSRGDESTSTWIPSDGQGFSQDNQVVPNQVVPVWQSCQTVMILCGVVGSGKSTFSKALVSHFPNYVHVNQDTLGSRQACERALRSALKEGKSVIVDRQNFNVDQRMTWVRIVRNFNNENENQDQVDRVESGGIGEKTRKVKIVYLKMGTLLEECKRRLWSRKNHPTIDSPELGMQVLGRVLKDWEGWTRKELEIVDGSMTLPENLGEELSKEELGKALNGFKFKIERVSWKRDMSSTPTSSPKITDRRGDRRPPAWGQGWRERDRDVVRAGWRERARQQPMSGDKEITDTWSNHTIPKAQEEESTRRRETQPAENSKKNF